MKYFKLILLSAGMMISTGSTFAQSRAGITTTSTPMATGISVQSKSPKLKEATGWMQTRSGAWISNTNAISDIVLSPSKVNSVAQNFKWLQLLTLMNGSQPVYALLFENSISEANNQAEKRVNYYVMDASSYAEVVALIAAKDGKTLTVKSSIYGYMGDIKHGQLSSEKLLSLISQSIASPQQARYNLVINAQHVDGKDVVRFRLPERSSIIDNGLDEGYFEVTLSEFNTILPPLVSGASDEFDLDAGHITPGNSPIPQNATRTVPNNVAQTITNEEIADRNASSKADNVTIAVDNTVDNVTLADDDTYNEIATDPQSNSADFGDRVNKERAVISEPIAVLSNIKGWYYNSEGVWVNDNSHSYNFDTVGKYEMRNFRYKSKYYLLITKYEKYAGETYYLVSKDDYVNSMNAISTDPIVRIPLIATASLGSNHEDMIKKGEQAIDAVQKADAVILRENVLVVQFKLSSTKNIARFYMFLEECNKYGGSNSPSSCNAKISSKIKYSDAHLVGTPELFSKMYYEISYDQFTKFFKRPLTVTPKNDTQLAPAKTTSRTQSDFDL